MKTAKNTNGQGQCALELREALESVNWWLGGICSELDEMGLWGDKEQDMLELVHNALERTKGMTA